MNLDHYDTLIFDLGEVIISLDFDAVIGGFVECSTKSKEEIQGLISDSEILHHYETGKTPNEVFIQACKDVLELDMNDQEFIEIWNRMLLDIPVEKVNILQRLKKSHQVLILSNTNSLHMDRFDEMMQQINGKATLGEIVHKAYYSHEMGLRKPDPEIYQALINENQLDPARTLFFDDKEENIQSAQTVGIHGVQIKTPDQLYRYFNA
jgi:putative hydrolase of the HAD superfamily